MVLAIDSVFRCWMLLNMVQPTPLFIPSNFYPIPKHRSESRGLVDIAHRICGGPRAPRKLVAADGSREASQLSLGTGRPPRCQNGFTRARSISRRKFVSPFILHPTASQWYEQTESVFIQQSPKQNKLNKIKMCDMVIKRIRHPI